MIRTAVTTQKHFGGGMASHDDQVTIFGGYDIEILDRAKINDKFDALS